MSPKRVSYLMIGLSVLLFAVIIGVAVGGDFLLQKQADKLSGLKAEDQVTKEQEVSLAQAKSDIEKYTPLEEIAKSVVPQDKNQAKTVREINSIAAKNSVTLQQISFDVSSLGLPSTVGAVAGGSTNQNLSQVKPVPGISGVYSLAITVSSGEGSPVPYYKFLKFLEDLESNRRTAHVSTISVTPSEDNSNNVSFSLILNAYLKP